MNKLERQSVIRSIFGIVSTIENECLFCNLQVAKFKCGINLDFSLLARVFEFSFNKQKKTF